MNLYFRLLILFITAGFKSPLSIFDRLTTRHRVLPNDLDLLGHMNNGRYLTIADGCRVELLIRAGLWKKMKQVNIYPVLAGEMIQFRKSLEPFQAYQIDTQTIAWDEKYIYVEHRYHRLGQMYALAIVKVRMIGQKHARYSPIDIIKLLDPNTEIEPTKNLELIQKWNESMQSHFKFPPTSL